MGVPGSDSWKGETVYAGNSLQHIPAGADIRAGINEGEFL